MSFLEKVEVCFLDDRDPARQDVDRWKVRPIRKINGEYEIQVNGTWCIACYGSQSFVESWETKGYGTTTYGTIHKDWRRTASDQYGASRFRATAETPLTIKACAVLGVHWPVEPDEVKRKYRQLVKTAHPDVGGNAERFHQIQEAYELLIEEAS